MPTSPDPSGFTKGTVRHDPEVVSVPLLSPIASWTMITSRIAHQEMDFSTAGGTQRGWDDEQCKSRAISLSD